MKKSQITLGGEYAFRQGEGGNAKRCVVLDTEQIYRNRYSWFGWADNVTYPVARPFGTGTGRMLVAVEVRFVLREGEWIEHGWSAWEEDPEEEVMYRWTPWAARSAELRRPWAEELADRAIRQEQSRQVREERRLREEASEVRRLEMLAWVAEEKAWTATWREERDARLSIQAQRRIYERLTDLVPEEETVRQIIETLDVRLQEPVPDPVRTLQGRESGRLSKAF